MHFYREENQAHVNSRKQQLITNFLGVQRNPNPNPNVKEPQPGPSTAPDSALDDLDYAGFERNGG